MKAHIEDVQNVLEEQSQPLSLASLQSLLGKDCSQRTLRRWLAQLVDDGKVSRIGKSSATRYRWLPQSTVTSLLLEEAPLTPVFSPRAQAILAKTNAPLQLRQPCTYNKQWLESYRPNETFYLTDTQRFQLQEKGTPKVVSLLAGTFANKVYDRLLIDLSYNSSRLEGNTYSLLETKELLLENKIAEGKLDLDKTMILNHKDAIRFIVKNIQKIAICPDDIQTIHYLLSDGLMAVEDAGAIRCHSVRISGTTYSPLEGQDRLNNLLATVLSIADKIVNPFEQSFFLLVHIAYLQAFANVNKRTARISANIPLVRKNVIPISFNDVDKKDFTSSIITIYERNDPSVLAELYCWSYLRTCDHYHTQSQVIGFDVIKVKYRDLRRDIISHVVLNVITGNAIERYVIQQANQRVSQDDRQRFIDDVLNEVKSLAPYRIKGMGISLTAFNQWYQRNSKS